MKKRLLIMLLVLSGVIHAAEMQVIANNSTVKDAEMARQTVMNMMHGMKNLDFDTVLAQYALDAVCVNSENKSKNLVEMKKELDAMRRGLPLIRNGLKDNNLANIMEGAAVIAGSSVSAKELENYRAMSPDDQKRVISLVRWPMEKLLGRMERMMAEIVDSVKIVSTDVAGDTAIVVTTGKNEKGKLEKTTFRLQKEEGRWLIKKSVSVYMTEEGK